MQRNEPSNQQLQSQCATCCPADRWSVSPSALFGRYRDRRLPEKKTVQKTRDDEPWPALRTTDFRPFTSAPSALCSPSHSPVSPPAHIRSCPRAGGRLRALEACRGVSRMSANDEVTKLWRVRKTVHKMLEDRKYLVSQEDLKRSKESVRARDGDRPGLSSASHARSVFSSRRSLANCRSERNSPSWHQRRTTQTTWCAASRASKPPALAHSLAGLPARTDAPRASPRSSSSFQRKRRLG